jgi:hypothetical protein
MTLTLREMRLARSALQKIVPAVPVLAAVPAAPKPRRKKENTGYREAERLKFERANEEYELRKAHGKCRLPEIEQEFELRPNSLKHWRSKRICEANPTVQTVYKPRS